LFKSHKRVSTSIPDSAAVPHTSVCLVNHVAISVEMTHILTGSRQE